MKESLCSDDGLGGMNESLCSDDGRLELEPRTPRAAGRAPVAREGNPCAAPEPSPPDGNDDDEPSELWQGLLMLLVLVVLGVSTCVIAWFINQMAIAIQFLHRKVEFMTTPYFATDCLAWAGMRALLVLLAVKLTAAVSPRAAGSGIPEMKCILAGLNLDQHMNLPTVVAKVLGLVLMIGAGMPVGREGPLVQIAGAIALALLRRPMFASVKNSEVRTHEVLGAACAVGVTAAFGAPLGGVLFSIEATTTYFLTSSYWHSFVCAVTGCVVFRYAATVGMGMEKFEATHEFAPGSRLFEIDYAVLPAHALLGAVCGLLASAFVSIAARLFRFTRPWTKDGHETVDVALTPKTRQEHIFRHRMLTMKYRKYLYAGCVALGAGVADYWIASGGGPRAQEKGGFMTSSLFRCTYDLMYFEDLANATYFLPTLEWEPAGVEVEAMDVDSGVCAAQELNRIGAFRQNVFNTDWGEYTVLGSLTIWCAVKLVSASLALTIFAPAGCLAPCIAIGAGLGRLTGEILTHFNFGCIPAAQLATAGAAAFAGGVTGTVSVAVIVFELTKQIHYSVPVLISVLTARIVASHFTESLYDTMLRLGRLPALPPTRSTDKQLRQVRRVIEGVSPRTPAASPMASTVSWQAGAPQAPGRVGSAGQFVTPQSIPQPPRERAASQPSQAKPPSPPWDDGEEDAAAPRESARESESL